MAPRKSQSRKTADKMAAYKAASSLNKQTPSRTSPRISKKNVRSPGSGRSSEQNRGSRIVDHNALQKELHVNVEGGHAMVGDAHLGRNARIFDEEEVIPETPTRDIQRLRPKRVFAPMKGDLRKVAEDEETLHEVSGIPSKKRKKFKATSQQDGSAATNVQAQNFRLPLLKGLQGQKEGELSSRSGDSYHEPPLSSSAEPSMQDTGDIEKEADDLFAPPLPSAQENLFSSPPRRSSVSRPSGTKKYAQKRGPRSLNIGSGSSDRSVGNAPSLDVLATSSVTMTRLFEKFATKMSAEMEVLHKEHMKEVKDVADSLRTSLRTEIRSVEGLFGMLTNGLKGFPPVRTVGKTSLSDWEKKLDELTPHARAIFGRELFSRILCFNTPLKAVEIFQKEGETSLAKASLSVQTLMFSLQPGDRKYRYSGSVGKMHSEFKFSVIQNTFFNVCRDTFDLFEQQTSSREQQKRVEDVVSEKVAVGVTSTRLKVICPTWLAPGKVTSDHINEARNFLEMPNQSRKGRIRQTPTPDDIACHGALRVYRLLGSYLHEGRGSLRSTFFQGFGYLLVPWEEHISDISQDTLTIKLDDDENGMDFRLDDVPYTAQCSFKDDILKVNSVDAENKELLRKLFSEWRGMIITVEHDVHVVNGNGVQRRHSGGQKKTLHRLINLIDVACDCCVDYCRAGSREVFLRTHKTALQCVMVFALLFKGLCVEFLEKVDTGVSSAASNVPDPTEVKVYGTSVKDMIPGLNTQRNLLRSKCTRMTRNEYDMLNHVQPFDELDVGNELQEKDIFDIRHIQESVDQGIGVI